MKVKRLRKIRISENVFNITWDKEEWGARFDIGKLEINIGTRSQEEMSIFTNVLHEIKEILHCLQRTRYLSGEHVDYLFSYSHKEHTDLCERLSGILSEFLF